MNPFSFPRGLPATFAAALLLAGCGDDRMGPDADLSTFDGVVQYGGTYEAVTPSETVDVISSGEETGDDGTRYVCTTERRSVIDAPPDYATFDPNSEVVYPGSLLRGATLGGATPEPIVVDRAGGSITIDLVNGSKSVSVDVDELTHGNVIQAMNDIIAENSGEVPAAFTYNFSEVQSTEQMALNMGVNARTLTTKLKAKLSFSTDRSYNRYLVELNQRYYTMSFGLPARLDDLFAPTVTPADLLRYVGPGDPATYVSSVTFGRRFYLLVESTSSSRDISASIDASYSAALAGGSAHLDGTYVKDLQNVNIKVFALGGDDGLALSTFNGDLDAVARFLTDGGGITNGVPLSYVVRNVADNSTVYVKVATDYEVKRCSVMSVGSYFENFDGGVSGWTGYADFKNLRTIAGTFAGNYLAANDKGEGGTWYFRAPLAWGGDWSHFYGGKITFYLYVGGSGGYFAKDDIVIYGRGGTRLAARFIGPGLPTSGFFKYELTLDETKLKVNGAAGTREQILDALGDVSDLFIRGEYKDGTDWGCIDEVRIQAPGA